MRRERERESSCRCIPRLFRTFFLPTCIDGEMGVGRDWKSCGHAVVRKSVLLNATGGCNVHAMPLRVYVERQPCSIASPFGTPIGAIVLFRGYSSPLSFLST